MNGKGDKLRKGANLKRYRDNYDKIFKKNKTNGTSSTVESLSGNGAGQS